MSIRFIHNIKCKSCNLVDTCISGNIDDEKIRAFNNVIIRKKPYYNKSYI